MQKNPAKKEEKMEGQITFGEEILIVFANGAELWVLLMEKGDNAKIDSEKLRWDGAKRRDGRRILQEI